MAPNSLAERIHYLREKNNLTYEEIGQMVGVGKSTVHKWEAGYIKNMRRDKIAKLAAALHTTPGYLMGWDEEESGVSAVSLDELSEAKRKMIERILTLTDDQIELLDRLADAALAR